MNASRILLHLLAFLPFVPSAHARDISFRRDVMPILFRAGCNSGTCHGAARGKDGFHLSLFGYDPKGDYFAITQEMIGRRVNVASPERSLLLRKAIGAVPHTGGKLFDRDSEYCRTLVQWIEAGAQDDVGEVPDVVALELSSKHFVFERQGLEDSLRVIALVSDGSRRDVTALARFHSNNPSIVEIDSDGHCSSKRPGDSHVFARFNRFTIGAEVIVLPSGEGFEWPETSPVNYIDRLVFDRLQKLRITPSELCDDETFLRRVTIDLAGRVPTVDEYRTFMAESHVEKRARKIDDLLKDDAFADLWTTIWAEQLRVMGGNYAPVGTHIKAADAFYEWIRSQLRSTVE